MSVNPAFDPEEVLEPNGSSVGPAPTVAATKAPDDDVLTQCGVWHFRPQFLQRFRSPKWLLLCLCWASAVQGMVVNGFVNVVITTIERRYGLSSKSSGMVASGYDMASLVGLIPIAYLGARPQASKPRWIGTGIALLSLGSLMFALPRVVFGTYETEDQQHQGGVKTCSPNSSFHSDPTSCDASSSAAHVSSSWSLVFFMVGQAMHGLGAAPLYTLGVAFLDDSVDTARSALYVAIFYTMAILGPACGYMLGNVFLRIYVDVGEVDPQRLGLTPESNLWVGAWWIGFVLTGLMGLLGAIPLLAFPPSLPGSAEIQAAKVSEAHQSKKHQQERQNPGEARNKEANPEANEDEEEEADSPRAAPMALQSSLQSFSQIPVAAKSLLRNPPFLFLSLAGGVDGLLISGLAAFLPKFLESQFAMTQAFAAFLVGIVTVPGGGGGTFLGGYIVKRFRMKCAGMLKTCIVASAAAFFLCFVFIANCPDMSSPGVNTSYPPQPGTESGLAPGRLDSWCNSDCHCSPSLYDPVCGSNNIMFYSPCYAGCRIRLKTNTTTAYTNCSCIVDGSSSQMEIEGKPQMVEAMRENCSSECNLLPVYLTALLFCMIATFLTTIPSLSATLRCVSSEERSLGLGIQWVLLRILGSIPGPMVFGAVIDTTCQLWQSQCNEAGNCRLYSNELLSRYILILVTCCKGITFIFFFLAWKLYKPPVRVMPDPIANGGTQ